ncbi:hypothetical protein OG900_19105 [Streptomyces sp. NBC_00433]
MAEQAQHNSALSAAVADVANGVALALDGEGDSYALSALLAQEDTVALAAVRVLGADVLAPYALRADPARGGTDRQVVHRALAAYPPGADASDVSLWSYRGLAEASRAFLPGSGEDAANGTGGEPGADWPPEARAGDAWVQADPWPRLAHRASQLAALSLPGLAPALAVGLAARTDDLARGFVRAVRRRDWLQAAGVGRWLVRAPDVPASLGLEAGLVFVRRMSGADPRVVLHATAAQRFPGGGPR